jgi:hypothetical protein
MILKALGKPDFSMASEMRVDLENRGFTDDELEKLAGADAHEEADARGAGDWWRRLWSPNRQVAPALQNLKSEFGYQSAPLLTDLLTVAEAQNTALDGVIKAKASEYNFYIMRCGVYIVPSGGERFDALKFEVRYKHDRVSTYTMLPGPQVKKILELGGKAEVGVDSKVTFGFPEVKLGAASVDASAKAKLDAKFIVSFEYELKTPVVDSLGIGNPFCRWLMHKGDALRNDVVFYPIVVTPKSVTGFDCEFRAHFKVSHPEWEHAELYANPPRTIAVSR